MRLAALLAKDARLLVRHRALLVALLAYPILLALVLGAAFQEPPSTLRLAVVDEDPRSALDVGGRRLTTSDLLAQAAPFAEVARVADEDAALGLVRRGEADAALLIPRGFLGDLGALGRGATLRLVVDESDPVRAGVARNAVEGAIEAFVRDVVQKKIDDVLVLLDLTEKGGTTTALFQRVEVLGVEKARERLEEVKARLDPRGAEAAKVQEVLDFLAFTEGVLANSETFLTTTALPLRVETSGLAARDAGLAGVALPGALVLGVFWTGSLAAALLVARERETGVRRRLAAAPGLRALPTLSKALVALAAALVPALLLVLLGALALDAVVARPLLVLAVLALASLAAAALGALAAGLARGTGGAALVAVLLLLPMLLLGGLFYPVAYMPPAAQAVARALPVTQATDALRGAMIRGSTLHELALPLALLALFALVAGGLAAWLERRAST